MRARIRAAVARRDAGMTMTEMLVVMLITGIIVAATAAVTISLTRTTGQNVARQDLVDEARTAVERMSKTTRTAVKPSQLLARCSGTCVEIDAFLRGTAQSMTFYANLDNPGNSVGPSQVTYAISPAGALVEKVQRPDSADPGDAGYTYCNAELTGATADCRSRLAVRTLAEGVDGSEATFRYYAKGGGELRPAGAGLSATQLEQVLAVEITLTVESASTTAPQPITYIQRITLPNAQAIVQQAEETTP